MRFLSQLLADYCLRIDRLEASRKYLFGSVGVLGTNNNSLIEGVFIARGPDITPVVNVAPDWESYNYEKIDLNNPEQKAYFEAALAWDLEVNGKKWADGKNVGILLYLLYCAAFLRCANTRLTVQVNTMINVQFVVLYATLCLASLCCFIRIVQIFATSQTEDRGDQT
jgi:hypothetical protein